MKRMQASRLALIALMTCAVSGNAHAHHAATPVYDQNKTIELKGTVVEYRLRSPHAHILMDVKNAKGVVERWTVESGAVGSMQRMGLGKDKLKPGDVVSIAAWANRVPERRLVWLNKITLADGTVVGGTFEELLNASLAQRKKLPARAGATGIEKLSGKWEMANFDLGTVDRPQTVLPLSPAGREAEKNYDPLRSPRLDCSLPTLPWLLPMPYVYEIKAKAGAGEVILHHEVYDVTRTVPLSSKPKLAEATGALGRVSGRIEGGTLIVDSSAYPPSRWGLAAAGTPLAGLADIPSSAQKKVTERYSVSEDGNTLKIAYTVEDPVYLSKQYSGTVILDRLPDDTPMDFKCDLESATEFIKETSARH